MATYGRRRANFPQQFSVFIDGQDGGSLPTIAKPRAAIGVARPSKLSYEIKPSDTNSSDELSRGERVAGPCSPRPLRVSSTKHTNMAPSKRLTMPAIAESHMLSDEDYPEDNSRQLRPIQRGRLEIVEPPTKESTHRLGFRHGSKSQERKTDHAVRGRSYSPSKMSISEPFNASKNGESLTSSKKKKPLPRAHSAMDFLKTNKHDYKQDYMKLKDVLSGKIHHLTHHQSQGSHDLEVPEKQPIDTWNVSHRWTPRGEEYPSFKKGDDGIRQATVRSSPKLETWLHEGSPRRHSVHVPPSPRRHSKMPSSRDEKYLYADQDDDVFGDADPVKGLGIIAPFTQSRDHLTSTVTPPIIDITTLDGMMSHEMRGQRTGSFCLTDVDPIDKPLANPLPAKLVKKLPDEPTEPLSVAISGLMQHPNVMEFAGHTPNAFIDGHGNDAQLSPAVSMEERADVPMINVQHTSITSKRSSAEAFLNQPPAKKRNRHSDPELLNSDDIGTLPVTSNMTQSLDDQYGDRNGSLSTDSSNEWQRTVGNITDLRSPPSDSAATLKSEVGRKHRSRLHMTSHSPRNQNPRSGKQRYRRGSVAKASQLTGTSYSAENHRRSQIKSRAKWAQLLRSGSYDFASNTEPLSPTSHNVRAIKPRMASDEWNEKRKGRVTSGAMRDSVEYDAEVSDVHSGRELRYVGKGKAREIQVRSSSNSPTKTSNDSGELRQEDRAEALAMMEGIKPVQGNARKTSKPTSPMQASAWETLMDARKAVRYDQAQASTPSLAPEQKQIHESERQVIGAVRQSVYYEEEDTTDELQMDWRYSDVGRAW